MKRGLFERFLVLSLYTKHQGFHDEREWCFACMKHWDTAGLPARMFDYHFGPKVLASHCARFIAVRA